MRAAHADLARKLDALVALIFSSGQDAQGFASSY